MAKSTLAAQQRFQPQLGLRDGPGEKAFVAYPSSLEDLILAAQSRPHTFSVAKFKQLELTEMGESGEKPFQKYQKCSDSSIKTVHSSLQHCRPWLL